MPVDAAVVMVQEHSSVCGAGEVGFLLHSVALVGCVVRGQGDAKEGDVVVVVGVVVAAHIACAKASRRDGRRQSNIVLSWCFRGSRLWPCSVARMNVLT